VAPVLVAVGLNQKSATVSDRERVAVKSEDLAAVVQGYASLDGVDEIVLVSTCYRVEAYAVTDCPAAAAVALRSALQARAGSDELPLFEMHGSDALRHVLRVASSLESAVLGEPQILGQVKDAHQRAAEAGAAGKELGSILDRVYEVAKRVRTETAIGRAGVSWGGAAATLAEKVLGSVKGRRVLVVGAGEMARLSAQHLRHEGASVVVVNRTQASAEALAAEVGGSAAPMEALAAELLAADVIVSAAPAAPSAFTPAELAATMRARRRRNLVMVDLAVPRAIPAESGAIDGVWLCDVDDLARLTARAQDERAQAVAHAERILAEEIARYEREQAERRAAPVIQAMRRHAAEIAREEVDRTARRIGADPDVEKRLAALANAVVSKLLHEPSTRLRRAAAEAQRGDRLIAAAAEIFDLHWDGAPPAARS
jgi:glutamyl-tRNA reductase